MSGITLKLDPAPTFWAKVEIPIPGADKGAEIECEFNHMTREAYAAFSASAAERTDLQTVMVMVRNWRGLDAPFSEDAAAKLLQNYHGAPYAITERFAAELGKARSGN